MFSLKGTRRDVDGDEASLDSPDELGTSINEEVACISRDDESRGGLLGIGHFGLRVIRIIEDIQSKWLKLQPPLVSEFAALFNDVKRVLTENVVIYSFKQLIQMVHYIKHIFP